MKTIRYAAVLAASALAACSGGTGQSIAPIAKVPAAQSSSPASNATRMQVHLRFAIPATNSGARASRYSFGRGREYVSPGTAGAIVTAVSTTAANQSADDASYAYDISSTSPLCTASSSGSNARTCTLNFDLVADTYQITVAGYDRAQTSASQPQGNELSADTETETVAIDQANQFAFYLLALVEGFYVPPSANETHATRDLPAVGTKTISANALASGTVQYLALDPDGYQIDEYTGLYGFWFGAGSGAFPVDVYDRGDPTTGCAGFYQCASAANDAGTSTDVSGSAPGAIITYPNGGGPPSGSSTYENETMTLSYYGGGGPGAAIEAWTSGGTPSGTSPYYVDVAIPQPAGDVAIQPSQYTEPHAYIVPLYGYSTDGNGNQTTMSTGNTLYEWAAQWAPPDGANPGGSSYAAYFMSPGTTTCKDTNGNVAFTIGTPAYYAGYGAVFPVTAGNTTATCTLTLSDGIDVITEALSVSSPVTPLTIPSPGSTYSPSPAVRSRKS